MSKLSVWLFVVVGLLGMLPAGAAAQEDRLQIVAANTIASDVVRTIVGDTADVTSLMPVGADPHSFSATPSDLALLAEADVVFLVGALYEEVLLEQIENAATDMNIVTLSQCVDILPFGGHSHDHEEGEEHDHEAEAEMTEAAHEDEHHEDAEAEPVIADETLAALCAGHIAEMEALHEASHEDESEHQDEMASTEEAAHEEDEHEHEHAHGRAEPLGRLAAIDCSAGHDHEEGEQAEEDHEEGEHDHAEGSCDPHVWMDPHNVIYWSWLIRDTMSALSPENADLYSENAAAYASLLDEMAHETLPAMLEGIPEERRVLVTDHETFAYYANAFDFEVVGVVVPAASTLAEASPQELADLIDVIRDERVPAVFAGTTVSPTLSERVAEEAGAAFYQLYTDSLSEPDGPAANYVDYMIFNTQTIADALTQE
jgi:ABC-type Zn uptake system ZnuABC Zn-binding protein ZnuA